MAANASDGAEATPDKKSRPKFRGRKPALPEPHYTDSDHNPPAKQVGPTRPPEGYAEDNPGSPAHEAPKQSGAK
ncbi:MAG: hypothetical protein NTW19_23760 [Planctomycetota bacterium]|nr:hypothetical protein [Planctomycetota bacterium]